MKSAMDTQAYISTKFNEGLEEGKVNKSIEIARNMLSNGLDRNIMARCTGLYKSEIDKIKSYKC